VKYFGTKQATANVLSVGESVIWDRSMIDFKTNSKTDVLIAVSAHQWIIGICVMPAGNFT